MSFNQKAETPYVDVENTNIRDQKAIGFRYFAGGPKFSFSTSSPLIAEVIIAALDEDRDDWTITDLENPCV